MEKKTVKHAVSIVLIGIFVALAFGSAANWPDIFSDASSGSSGGGSDSTRTKYNVTIYYLEPPRDYDGYRYRGSKSYTMAASSSYEAEDMAIRRFQALYSKYEITRISSYKTS